MKSTNEKLNIMREALKSRKARVMIIGLGSVGNYLLDYLMSTADEDLEICVVGRNDAKLQSDVNIVRVASMIRRQNKSTVSVISNVDLTDVDAIAEAIKSFSPDIIVNSSRAYPGLKYGSISWANIRAYGIWSPLAIRFTKNIMAAYEKAQSDAIVINTSYSDAVIPWLKSAGMAYPDFGSGNINHLLPRIKFAVAKEYDIKDYWNIDITFAVAHFHDVVISKEGHTEGVDMLIDIRYGGKKLEPDMKKILSECSIPMPVDAKRNQMNASSNFEIIEAILGAVRAGKKTKLHCPGVFGEIGGYPVIVDGSEGEVKAYICEEHFTLNEMRAKNRESIYLDGVENVENGVLTYTDELIAKVRKAFGVDLVKTVAFDEIDATAAFIIKEIIEKNV
ncbi:MAG: saccharopine dehydrogenase NADP-binding domain-containing protein [Huintestinicola sp.]|uniref:saccharopine dehydrogenase NADP-binding domain-containing protein n=1 Tax=Huintestinicola sp. TaxID=2981661 RepID=UPI003F08561C